MGNRSSTTNVLCYFNESYLMLVYCMVSGLTTTRNAQVLLLVISKFISSAVTCHLYIDYNFDWHCVFCHHYNSFLHRILIGHLSGFSCENL